MFSPLFSMLLNTSIEFFNISFGEKKTSDILTGSDMNKNQTQQRL